MITQNLPISSRTINSSELWRKHFTTGNRDSKRKRTVTSSQTNSITKDVRVHNPKALRSHDICHHIYDNHLEHNHHFNSESFVIVRLIFSSIKLSLIYFFTYLSYFLIIFSISLFCQAEQGSSTKIVIKKPIKQLTTRLPRYRGKVVISE